jgi:two-component system copper resistance phosphate regulon response regulator CusR
MAVLVAEDAPQLRSLLVRSLREEGFEVRACADGEEADRLLADTRFDAVVLDWMLPGLSGMELVRRTRARGDDTPVVMLTARDGLGDRVAALDAGADDYLTKPFALEELLARLRAVLRRSTPRPGPPLAYADLTLDAAARTANRAGVPLRLTAREFALLRFLVEHAGEVVSRARIVAEVWGTEDDGLTNVVDVFIHHLRDKVDADFGLPLIHTVRGAGYVLRRSR